MINSPDGKWFISQMHKRKNNPTLADIERFCELVAKLCESGEDLNEARIIAFREIINE